MLEQDWHTPWSPGRTKYTYGLITIIEEKFIELAPTIYLTLTVSNVGILSNNRHEIGD